MTHAWSILTSTAPLLSVPPLLSGFSHPRLLGSEARHLATGKEIIMHDKMVHLECCEDMKKEKGVTCLGNLLDRAFDGQ